NSKESPCHGFTAALAVLITGASQSRQHDTLVRLPIDIRLKYRFRKSVGNSMLILFVMSSSEDKKPCYIGSFTELCKVRSEHISRSGLVVSGLGFSVKRSDCSSGDSDVSRFKSRHASVE
ncbi:hypothetical protein Tco_0738101, partial [Tanacetum coccineum]